MSSNDLTQNDEPTPVVAVDDSSEVVDAALAEVESMMNKSIMSLLAPGDGDGDGVDGEMTSLDQEVKDQNASDEKKKHAEDRQQERERVKMSVDDLVSLWTEIKFITTKEAADATARRLAIAFTKKTNQRQVRYTYSASVMHIIHSSLFFYFSRLLLPRCCYFIHPLPPFYPFQTVPQFVIPRNGLSMKCSS